MSKLRAIDHKGYKLLHNGAIALAQVEQNGMKVDEKYLMSTLRHLEDDIEEKQIQLKKDEVFKTWKKVFGGRTNLGSRYQLGTILFKHLGYHCPAYTLKTGQPKTDESALETVDLDFVHDFLTVERLKKTKSTYLEGILKYTDNGFLHPSFNLHLAQTYRSSSDSPNFQNMPIRNPVISKLVRQCFVSRFPNGQICEADYGGIEVKAAAWYHKDPTMLKYIEDDSKDMHRDMAQECYLLPLHEMTKEIRYCGKNKFVFPEFYGDFYIHCAKSLWDAIGQMNLKTKSGVSLKKWLRSKGIKKLGSCNPKMPARPGTFAYHIKKVEDRFWNDRFYVYKKWKDEWWKAYRKTGRFNLLTGFEIEGFYKRNEVINYPVQGVAFHCLLWALIRLQKLLKKYKMKSCIIGQIHDSIVSDILENERDDYIEIINNVMINDLKKHWKFIITPMEIEIEISPVGTSWFEKEKIIV